MGAGEALQIGVLGDDARVALSGEDERGGGRQRLGLNAELDRRVRVPELAHGSDERFEREEGVDRQ